MNIDLTVCENLNREDVYQFLNSVFEYMDPLELKYEWDLYVNEMSCVPFFDTAYFTTFNNLTTNQLNEDCDSVIALNYPKVKDLYELFEIIDENIDFEKIDEEFKKQKEETLCEVLKKNIMRFVDQLY